MTTLRRLATGTVAATLSLSALAILSACGDDGTDAADALSPAEALDSAQARLDETSGVRLSLATDGAPDAEAFLSAAEGVITADPAAFEGTASGRFDGFPADDVEVVSVGGAAYVKLFGDFADFDLPTCVPDPAGLLDPRSGVSSVLAEADDATAGDSVRGGDDNREILTPYTATVPGDAVRNLLPCAPGDAFDTTFTIDAEGELSSAEITGVFFAGSGELTYTITVDDYDVEQEITKP